jgi:CheY-like chemotaxis protein
MNGHVLVIEDNEQNRYLVTYLLEQHGHRVVAASGAPEGIVLARAEPPALILLDIQLPVMDGYAVARTLRQDPNLSRVPIVAVTSYAMPGDREKALEAGCVGYIEKPIDPATFVAEIEQLLEAAGSRDTAAP